MEELLKNIDKIHTTPMGVNRIKKNLQLNDIDVIKYCKDFLTQKNTFITRQGKNWYARKENIIFTINAYSYTIITAHIVK